MKTFVVAIMLLIVCSTALHAAQNPFRARGEAAGDAVSTQTVSAAPAHWRWIQPALRWTNDLQKAIKDRMTGFARDMKSNPFGASFWLFLLMSFAYGVVHAIGPGHGKSIAVSYFLSSPGHVLHGLLMGNLIAFVHVLSGVFVILCIYLILNTTGMASFDAVSPAIEKVSYTLMIVIGLYLAWNAIRGVRSGKFSVEMKDASRVDLKGLIATSAVTGLVPCPGAAIVLSFSIILGIMWQGLIAMIMIALGMGLTSSAFAIAAIVARKTVLKLSSVSERAFIIIYVTLSMLGAAIIIALGAVLLMGSG
jgi:nickel/cobalt transporter (NicO) family protein